MRILYTRETSVKTIDLYPIHSDTFDAYVFVLVKFRGSPCHFHQTNPNVFFETLLVLLSRSYNLRLFQSANFHYLNGSLIVHQCQYCTVAIMLVRRSGLFDPLQSWNILLYYIPTNNQYVLIVNFLSVFPLQLWTVVNHRLLSNLMVEQALVCVPFFWCKQCYHRGLFWHSWYRRGMLLFCLQYNDVR